MVSNLNISFLISQCLNDRAEGRGVTGCPGVRGRLLVRSSLGMSMCSKIFNHLFIFHLFSIFDVKGIAIQNSDVI